MKSRKYKIGCVLAVLAIMAGMLWAILSGFEDIALHPVSYIGYQRELNVYPDVGVDQEELNYVQYDVAQYLNGRDASLNNERVIMFGVEQPIFNEREIAHMEDVKKLFELERIMKNGAWLLALTLGLFALLMTWAEGALWCGLYALGGWVLIALILGIACGFNFEAAFTKFHELLFDNDLWLLDPRTDAMIRMYPQAFFEKMAYSIGKRMLTSAGYWWIIGSLSFMPWNKWKQWLEGIMEIEGKQNETNQNSGN